MRAGDVGAQVVGFCRRDGDEMAHCTHLVERDVYVHMVHLGPIHI